MVRVVDRRAEYFVSHASSLTFPDATEFRVRNNGEDVQ